MCIHSHFCIGIHMNTVWMWGVVLWAGVKLAGVMIDFTGKADILAPAKFMMSRSKMKQISRWIFCKNIRVPRS